MNAGTPPTALIVDDDVAFIFWLGELFNENGYQALPALHCRQAVTMAKKMDMRVDVLVVNPKLRGASRAIAALKSAKPGLRVVLISDPSAPETTPDSTRATLERPAAWEPVSRPQWITKLRKILMRPPPQSDGKPRG